MDDEGKEAIDEVMKTCEHEFRTVKQLIETYIQRAEPIDPEGKYFRLRFLEKICGDLITILEQRGVDSDIMQGTEAAIRIFDRSKNIGKFEPE